MSDWTNSHDLVYAFVCVSFLADGDVDESEKEAMRGNVKVMLPDMGDDEYHQVEKEVMQLLKQLHEGGLLVIPNQNDAPNVEFKKSS